jgi:hypothetical protein
VPWAVSGEHGKASREAYFAIGDTALLSSLHAQQHHGYREAVAVYGKDGAAIDNRLHTTE